MPLVPVCPLEEAEAEGNGGVAVEGCSAPPSSEALGCALDPDLCPCHAKEVFEQKCTTLRLIAR